MVPTQDVAPSLALHAALGELPPPGYLPAAVVAVVLAAIAVALVLAARRRDVE